MKRPTAEEIAAAKADAQARFGRSCVLGVQFSDPIGTMVVMAPWDFESYCLKADEDATDRQTGFRNQCLRARLWPSQAEFVALLAEWPDAAEKIVAELMVRAGTLPGEPIVERLSDSIRHARGGEPIPGLTTEAATKLLDSHKGMELWAVRGPGPLSVVMSKPESEVWLAAKVARQHSVQAQKRIVMAAHEYVAQTIVWSHEPIEAVLADKPAMSRDLRAAYETLGGAGAEVTSKSL